MFASCKGDFNLEVLVFNLANSWLKHNSKDQSKYAKQLTQLKVLLDLLSEITVKCFLIELLYLREKM